MMIKPIKCGMRRAVSFSGRVTRPPHCDTPFQFFVSHVNGVIVPVPAYWSNLAVTVLVSGLMVNRITLVRDCSNEPDCVASSAAGPRLGAQTITISLQCLVGDDCALAYFQSRPFSGVLGLKFSIPCFLTSRAGLSGQSML